MFMDASAIALARDNDLPIIVFSSIMAEDIKRKAQSVGADAQISKPEIALLVETVTRLMKATRG